MLHQKYVLLDLDWPEQHFPYLLNITQYILNYQQFTYIKHIQIKIFLILCNLTQLLLGPNPRTPQNNIHFRSFENYLLYRLFQGPLQLSIGHIVFIPIFLHYRLGSITPIQQYILTKLQWTILHFLHEHPMILGTLDSPQQNYHFKLINQGNDLQPNSYKFLHFPNVNI